ncbi:MAG: universal stress protein [Chloroherpetonaceae bacterium]|nr:universal stress protein [Chthonomonadaceae bacterium]MDW8207400.1 universal stress protein [Chloroherpetonaceae bacterium]
MLQTVLLGTDGSEHALQAARFVAAIARPESTVIVLNVLDLTDVFSPYAMTPGIVPAPQALVETAEEVQHRIVEKTCAVLDAAGITCRTRCELGQTVDTIVRVAEEEHADLIVVGSQGLSGIVRFLIGSVSEGVARHAHCPVLVVRGERAAVRNILLAFDGSEASVRAARVAVMLATLQGASLTVLTVREPERSSALALEQQEIVRRAEEAAGLSGAKHVLQFGEGHPAEVLLHYAQEQQADLIVVGSRGLSNFQRLLLGSVSHAVLHHASCPVLVVR